MPETKTTLTRRIAVPVLIALSLAFPVGIAAHTTEQIAATGGMTVPLLGASLSVKIELDVVGHISKVTFTPAGTLTETRSGDHGVSFANEDGTVKVDIKARGHKLAVKAKTGSLDDLVGTGVWSAAVFGPGTESSVEYTIGKSGGKPTLTIDRVTVPTGVTGTDSPIKTSGNNVSGRVTFESDGYRKTLSIRVHVDQGGGKAMLRIVLSGKDKQRLSGGLDALVAAGNRTWSAQLCDETSATVTYRVNADGAVAFVAADPSGVSVKTKGKGFTATFDGTKVRVSVSLKANNGSYELKVDGKSGKCGDDKDKAKSERKDKAAKAKPRKDGS